MAVVPPETGTHTSVRRRAERWEGRSSSLGLLGPAVLGVAIGVDALLAALVLIAPPGVPEDDLTVIGMHNFRPERDTAVYLGAGLVAVVSALVLSRFRPVRRSRVAPPSPWLAVGVGGAAVAGAAVAFLQARRSLPLSSSASQAYLGVSVAVAAVCVLAAKSTSRPRDEGCSLRPRAEDAAVRMRPGWLDLVVPLVVSGFLYLPGWRQLAGNAFYDEGSLHLDFFGFGPALAFQTGADLGTDLHPYYGFGWAVVFALLEPLSYGSIIRLEVLYGCLYFSGVYLLLRALVGDRRWAAGGTALAVLFQVFAGFPSALLVWRFPSATVMRWPFDIWFFLACVLYLRTRRTRWAVTAGALVSLAVVFETDTGLALAAAFGLFWICVWRMEGTTSFRLLAWTALVSTAVLVAGLGIASRWTVLTPAFWTGWLENLQLSARGGTLLPLTTEPTTWNLAVFVVFTAVYLTFVCAAALRIARRQVTAATAVLGCIALYGFLTFLYFVGRSHPINLFRPTVPMALLIGASGGLAHRALVERRHAPHRPTRYGPGAVAWAALAAALLMLAANPGARAYPGLIRSSADDGAARGLCLFEDPDDVCGLPPEARQSVADLHALAARLRALGSSTTSVAVLDQTGPVVQHMAGARPWGRYLPLFPSLVTRAQRGAVLRDLREQPPALVVMRASAEGAPPFVGFWWDYYIDTWQALRAPLERDFVLDSRVGPFEIWRRPP